MVQNIINFLVDIRKYGLCMREDHLQARAQEGNLYALS